MIGQSPTHPPDLVISLSNADNRRASLASSRQSSEITFLSDFDQINSLRSEELLCRLVEARGESLHIYLEKSEIQNLHVEQIDRLLTLFCRQQITSVPHIRRIYRGFGPPITFGILGLILIILGSILALCGRNFRQITKYYHSGDATLNFQLTESDWDEAAEVFVYFYVVRFYGAYRPTYTSRPSHLFPGYSCNAPGSLADISAIRPLNTLPEIPASAPDGTLFFPCGISSFSIFNDKIELYKNSATPTQVNFTTNNISPEHSLINYARLDRPNNQSPANDWINVLGSQYRNWMETPSGISRWILIGRIPGGLELGKYSIKFTQNVWPSELWSAEKAVVFSQLSLIGSRQSVLFIGFVTWGAVMIIVSLLILALSATQWRLKTLSAASVSNERIEEVLTSLSHSGATARQELMSRLQKRRMDSVESAKRASR